MTAGRYVMTAIAGLLLLAGCNPDPAGSYEPPLLLRSEELAGHYDLIHIYIFPQEGDVITENTIPGWSGSMTFFDNNMTAHGSFATHWETKHEFFQVWTINSLWDSYITINEYGCVTNIGITRNSANELALHYGGGCGYNKISLVWQKTAELNL